MQEKLSVAYHKERRPADEETTSNEQNNENKSSFTARDPVLWVRI